MSQKSSLRASTDKLHSLIVLEASPSRSIHGGSDGSQTLLVRRIKLHPRVLKTVEPDSFALGSPSKVKKAWDLHTDLSSNFLERVILKVYSASCVYFLNSEESC